MSQKLYQMTMIWAALAAWLSAGSESVAAAEEPSYYALPVQELEFPETSLPAADRIIVIRDWQLAPAMVPYAVMEGGGEIYISHEGHDYDQLLDATVAIKSVQGRDVKGQLFWPKPDYSGMVKLRFSVPSEKANLANKPDFYRAKKNHYARLLQRDIAGAAWYRHQIRSASQVLGEEKPEFEDQDRRFFGRRWGNDPEDTLALVSGGRALSENLQLDRVLPRAEAGVETIQTDSIEGIRVQEIDWKPLLPDETPAADPLASSIPDDQHALFLPSFAGLVRLIDQAVVYGTPLLRTSNPRAEDAQTLDRYQQQLGLPLNQAARLLGPHTIKSIAITGGDPYFRTGTDVAVLFEAKEPRALRQLIAAQVATEAQQIRGSERVEGSIGDVDYSGHRSPDRAICSYVAMLDNIVLVTNSLAQLERLVEVHQGKRPALAELDEYDFFRYRYQRGDEAETAFLLISDKTIRRWCGPRWRIGTSRRTQAVALMAELQAAHLDKLVSGNVTTGPLHTSYFVPQTGQLTLTPEGVRSEAYGSLEFQTPILELELDTVTSQEAELYRSWKEGYERYWSTFFDPIAIRLVIDEQKLAVDLSVMPLITGSDYRTWIDLTRGGTIESGDGDPHNALLHGIMSINRDSGLIASANSFARSMAPQLRADPLSWLGDSVALYIDNDPFWKEVSEAEDPDEFMEKNFHRLPIAVHAAVNDGLRLTVFLTGLRAFIEQTAPGMTVWDTVDYKGRTYVKISPSAQAKAGNEDLDDAAVYYAASGKALILTLNENVLRRAIDRQLAGAEGNQDGEAQRALRPWVGDNLCLQVQNKAVQIVNVAFREQYQQIMQLRAWGNIPILNEWKRHYPDKNPIELHERYWQHALVCPGGGTYRWNEQWQTMESTKYGHPGEPRQGPSLPEALQKIVFGNFGLTFEEQGLRARAALWRSLPQ